MPAGATSGALTVYLSFFTARLLDSGAGPEFVAQAVQEWIGVVGSKTTYIERGSPWENGYIESFNARLRDELLNGEIFYTLRECPDRHRELAMPLICSVAGCATPTGSAGHA